MVGFIKFQEFYLVSMPSAVFATFIWPAKILLQERLYWSRHLDFTMPLDFIYLVCNSTYPVVDWEKRNSCLSSF